MYICVHACHVLFIVLYFLKQYTGKQKCLKWLAANVAPTFRTLFSHKFSSASYREISTHFITLPHSRSFIRCAGLTDDGRISSDESDERNSKRAQGVPSTAGHLTLIRLQHLIQQPKYRSLTCAKPLTLTLVTCYSTQLKYVTNYLIIRIKHVGHIWTLHWMILLAY